MTIWRKYIDVKAIWETKDGVFYKTDSLYNSIDKQHDCALLLPID